MNLCEQFEKAHGSPPRLFRAPGRVNLIGEHTDYNEGFVLPVAIHLETRVAVGPAPGRTVFIQSTGYPDDAVLDLNESNPVPLHHWSDYVRGVALFLEREGFLLQGARILIESDIPPGAGLSSSAALEVAAAFAFLSNSGLPADPMKVAQACHAAENQFVGTRSGIMDQFASCHGKRDHALLLDCRSLELRYVPLPRDVATIVCNTMTRHQLASGEYNVRRSQCEEGVRLISQFLPNIRALRDVTPIQLEAIADKLPPLIHRRCRHVVEENQRVLSAANALQLGKMEEFGDLMIASHRSLQADYEVSTPELDLMCEIALIPAGVYGARMVGGGFGGCVAALVRESCAAAFQDYVSREYRRRTGIGCELYKCLAADAAGPVGG